MLYLDLALENVARGAAERGAGKATGAAAGPLVGPLLQNLALSTGARLVCLSPLTLTSDCCVSPLSNSLRARRPAAALPGPAIFRSYVYLILAR